ncbi:MAG: hypothetical protein QME60_00660 [Verrucomicrobiota bacterium]|nr:hypothetical protein [Verrucomicrobiota bacterium]
MAFTTMGKVDKALLDRVVRHVGAVMWCPTRVLAGQKKPANLSEAAAKELAGLIGQDNICLLALANLPDKKDSRNAVFASHGVAMLNVASLKPSATTGKDAAESYARRVEKESVRLVAMLLGVDPCPMPLCALRLTKDEEGLDAKGRNACPPCQGKIEKTLRGKGVKLTIDPPDQPAPVGTPQGRGRSEACRGRRKVEGRRWEVEGRAPQVRPA